MFKTHWNSEALAGIDTFYSTNFIGLEEIIPKILDYHWSLKTSMDHEMGNKIRPIHFRTSRERHSMKSLSRDELHETKTADISKQTILLDAMKLLLHMVIQNVFCIKY